MKLTRKKIEKLEKECMDLNCNDNYENPLTCDKCKISTKYEELVGLRMEDV